MSGSLRNEFSQKTPRELNCGSEHNSAICSLRPHDINWPKQLAESVHPFVDVIGDSTLQSETSVAVFCSSQCPGAAILKAMKWISEIADDETKTVIGGFHSAMEKSFLEILLDGKCRLIVCPARSLERNRIPATFKTRIAQGRLTIASSMRNSVRMNSATSSHHRNQLVASLAQQIVVTYASPESRAEQLALELLRNGRPIHCLDTGSESLASSGCGNSTLRQMPRRSELGLCRQ